MGKMERAGIGVCEQEKSSFESSNSVAGGGSGESQTNTEISSSPKKGKLGSNEKDVRKKVQVDPGGRDGTSTLFGKCDDKSKASMDLSENEDGKGKPCSSLFGVKPNEKSSFPPMRILSNLGSGKFSISVLDEIIYHNITKMENVLVGNFLCPRPNIEVVREFFKNKWKTSGLVLVAALPKGFFAFQFTCKEDSRAVRSGGPWVIRKSSLALKKWSSKVDLFDSIFEMVLVWVRLPSLPLEYWNTDIFNGIASSFVEILSIDTMTTARKRLGYSSICVGVSQNADLPSSIDIQSKLGV